MYYIYCIDTQLLLYIDVLFITYMFSVVCITGETLRLYVL